MLRRICVLLLLALGLALARADEPDLVEGLKPLFNGKDLDGWKEAGGKKAALDGKDEAYKGRFKVVKGVLTIDPAVKGDVSIETAKAFAKDVHVRIDFKAGPKCNNDVFLRGSKFDIVPGKNETKAVKQGEWATLDIIVTGDSIEHKINGVSVRKAKTKGKASPLKLRAEFGAIQIKGIRVKE